MCLSDCPVFRWNNAFWRTSHYIYVGTNHSCVCTSSVTVPSAWTSMSFTAHTHIVCATQSRQFVFRLPTADLRRHKNKYRFGLDFFADVFVVVVEGWLEHDVVYLIFCVVVVDESLALFHIVTQCTDGKMRIIRWTWISNNFSINGQLQFAMHVSWAVYIFRIIISTSLFVVDM